MTTYRCTASVVDPFGNILGIMYNPHYLEVQAAGAGVDAPRPSGGWNGARSSGA
jgi:hypothetical protein